MLNRNFTMTPALERQVQLWNQLLDANRSIWALYAPWLQVTPWLWNAAAGTPVEKIETEAVVDGLPDPLELQARSWNHFLDASKQFWTAFSWPPVVDSAASDGASREAANDSPAPVRKVRSRSAHH
jgi:hypothetical protein